MNFTNKFKLKLYYTFSLLSFLSTLQIDLMRAVACDIKGNDVIFSCRRVGIDDCLSQRSLAAVSRAGDRDRCQQRARFQLFEDTGGWGVSSPSIAANGLS